MFKVVLQLMLNHFFSLHNYFWKVYYCFFLNRDFSNRAEQTQTHVELGVRHQWRHDFCHALSSSPYVLHSSPRFYLLTLQRHLFSERRNDSGRTALCVQRPELGEADGGHCDVYTLYCSGHFEPDIFVPSLSVTFVDIF